MARPGRIRGVGSIFGVLRNVLPGDTADTVGKIRLLTGQPEGDGAPCWILPNPACGTAVHAEFDCVERHSTSRDCAHACGICLSN